MSDKLQFRISSALKDIIGKDLISDDYIAIFELVKNSFDAHARNVIVRFEDIYTENARIIISDDGKGMDHTDLVNKWLFVAYSAKKDGSEDQDIDYRDNIYSRRPFAGAKGIGRFSCDRLGKNLYIETKKQSQNTAETLVINWEEFENNDKKEFVDVEVTHNTIQSGNFGITHGTILIIDNLRDNWDRAKLLKLKSALAKLINPSFSSNDNSFTIKLDVPDELDRDKDHSHAYEIVNGDVDNFIFEALGLKTTKIFTRITENGDYIETELRDGGRLIYKIKERNTFTLLNNINYTLYYLNMSAKLTFTRRMGLPSNQYGHVFLYKNGFRIYPYGEPGEDPLKVDARKAQGYNRFLGNRELIGEISINSNTDALKETSSRGDGLIKTPSYDQLEDCFWEVLKRLEKYVVEVQQWGLSIEDEGSFDLKTRASEFIAKLSGSDQISEFTIDDNFFEILEASQSNSAEVIVKNLNRIALESNDKNLIGQARQAADKLVQIQRAREEAEIQADTERRKAAEATTKLKEQISENLFLKSINTSEYQEVISLLHHIGIYAGTIDNNLKGISLRVQNNIPLTNDELNNIVRLLSFETKKILNIAAFATKANFRLKTEMIEINLNEYIREYVQNIIPTVTDKSLNVIFEDYTDEEYIKVLKPIELNIVIDNLVSNAKKVGAKNMTISLHKIDSDTLQILFEDNGSGIDEKNLLKLYDFGFTTTDGSGLGLYHVKEIMKTMGGKIKAENNVNKPGATFKIEIKK